MKFRWHLLLFVMIFGIEGSRALLKYRNSEPPVGDAAEVHNIAYNLAHGRGYRFDWNDANWRKLWQAQNVDGRFDFIVARRGNYPTMSRPPLMPLIVAGVLRFFPHASFAGWRVVDSAGFAAAACLLCDVAFVQGGLVGLIAMVVLLLIDPWRRMFIPGWWTEGLAFDFLSLIVWLLSNGKRHSPTRCNIAAGLAVGLLCLDRSMFVLLIPALCILLAIASSRAKDRWAKQALVIMAISVLIQMPWWIRNVAISGRLLPLGTQGGVNLPDEYGDNAMVNRGVWTGRGIRDAWTLVQPVGQPIALPAGMSASDFSKLWPWDVTNQRAQAVMVALSGTSLESEIAVSDAGKHAAIEWIRTHYLQIPQLMIEKAWTLTRDVRVALSIAILISAIGCFGSPEQRRIIFCMATLIGLYVLLIMVTHVVHLRFVILVFPPLYVGVTLGISAMVQRVRRPYLSISILGSIKA